MNIIHLLFCARHFGHTHILYASLDYYQRLWWHCTYIAANLVYGNRFFVLFKNTRRSQAIKVTTGSFVIDFLPKIITLPYDRIARARTHTTFLYFKQILDVFLSLSLRKSIRHRPPLICWWRASPQRASVGLVGYEYNVCFNVQQTI